MEGRVVRMCWVNFQCQGVLLIRIIVGQGRMLIWIIVGHGPIALAVHCKKSVDFTVKYLASDCQFFYRYFYGRLPVEHF